MSDTSKLKQTIESIFPMDNPSTGIQEPDSQEHVKYQIVKTIFPDSLQENLNNETNRIMIDFDGVIYRYDGFNNGYIELLRPPINDCVQVIQNFKERGYQIVIFTTRASPSSQRNVPVEKLVQDVIAYLRTWNIPYDLITAEKLSAVAYIDDRAIKFENNWIDILKNPDLNK